MGTVLNESCFSEELNFYQFRRSKNKLKKNAMFDCKIITVEIVYTTLVTFTRITKLYAVRMKNFYRYISVKEDCAFVSTKAETISPLNPPLAHV